MPEFYAAGLRPQLEHFDQSNPNIDIVIVTADVPAYFPNFGSELSDYLEDVEALMGSADVHIGASQFDPLTTRAGYVLDIEVLISADFTFNEDDFYAPMLESFRWDGGTWALPIAAEMQVMHYNPAAFDAAGLAHPDESWTVDDLFSIAEELAVRAPDGTVTSPSVTSFASVPYLSMLSLGKPLFDPLQMEISPVVDGLDLTALVERWARLESEGYMARDRQFNRPIILGASTIANETARSGYKLMTLPGAPATLLPVAAGISSGTQFPQEAYQVVRFLTEEKGVFNTFRQPVPGRSSLAGGEIVASNGFMDETIRDEVFQIAETAEPYTNLLFFRYVFGAFKDVQDNGTDAHVALIDMQARAEDDLQIAASRRENDIIVEGVETPAEGSVTIRFATISTAPALWSPASAEFAAVHDRVDSVEVFQLTNSTTSPMALSEISERADCFYSPSRFITIEGLSGLLAIEPLLSVDPDIERSDFPGRILSHLSENDVLYGFPFAIRPQIIVYDIDRFESNAVLPPPHAWDVNEFEEILRSIKRRPGDPPVLDIRPRDGTALMNLIAAYGGVPLDFRSNPPIVDFTSEASVNAIRQVLDLAHDGYLQLDPLSFVDETLEQDVEDAALYVQFLSDDQNRAFRLNAIDTGTGNYGIVTFPQGRNYSGIDYDLGAGYISPETPYASECYDLLTYLSERPDVYDGIPARTAVLGSDLLRQLESEETLAFYESVHELLQHPGVVEFPYEGTLDLVVHANNFVRLWLFRAMDRYLHEDADLEGELTSAEEFTLLFQQCIATIPPFDAKTQNANRFFEPYITCASDVDDTI